MPCWNAFVETRMIIRLHPTHARTTRIVMFVLLGCAAIAFWAGFHFNDHDGSSKQSLMLVGAFMALGTAAMLVAVARAYVCKCPECQAWLLERKKTTPELMTRVFICRRCNMAWDSKLRFNDD